MSLRLKRKTLTVARILERTLGIPKQYPPLPDPLETLIATILSQNTNDKNSHRAYTALRTRYRSWSEVETAPARSLEATIRSGGMARQKAGRIKEVLRIVRQKYGNAGLAALEGRPDAEVIRELTQMKGVGPKTASCVLLFSLGRDIFPVDTHVHRLCVRLGLARASRSPEHTFVAMRDLVPKGRSYSLHTNMIRFGRRVCRTNNPSCEECPLFRLCEFDKKTRRNGRPRNGAADHDFMLLDNVVVPEGRRTRTWK